jgi:hypothetical protein
MSWHIINGKDYIDGPFESMKTALSEARVLGKDGRVDPRLRRKADGFYIYHPPYDREEKWQPEYWICTEEAAIRQGVPSRIFEQPLMENWR